MIHGKYDGKRRKMQQNIKGQMGLRGFHSEKRVRKRQMSRAGYGQKFRYALNDSTNESLPQAHKPLRFSEIASDIFPVSAHAPQPWVSDDPYKKDGVKIHLICIIT
jgi:hypothetical protein